jgi:drug/metabolite transporter (DMT)-like permease
MHRPSPTQRARLLRTTEGTSAEAFGPVEWSLLGAIAAIWGSSFLFIAVGLDAFHPYLISFLRVALGGAALGAIPRSRRAIDTADVPTIVVLGVVWMAIPLLLFPIAQQWISSSLTGMLNGAMPLFSAAIAALLLRRLPGPLQAAGLVLGFGGIVLISLPDFGLGGTAAAGVALVILATVCYGFAVNLAVPLQQRYGSLPVLLRSQMVAITLTAPFGAWGAFHSSFAWRSALAVTALGILGTGLAYVAMANLVGRAGATRGAVAIYFIPVVAIALGVVFRDETVEAVSLVGVVLVLSGAYLTSRRERALVRR